MNIDTLTTETLSPEHTEGVRVFKWEGGGIFFFFLSLQVQSSVQ